MEGASEEGWLLYNQVPTPEGHTNGERIGRDRGGPRSALASPASVCVEPSTGWCPVHSPVSSSEAHARELQLTVCILPPHFPATFTGAAKDSMLAATDSGRKVLLLKAPPRTLERKPRLNTRTQ